jgi:hypothetical protein
MCIILNGYVEMLYHIMTMGHITETSQFPSQKMTLSHIYLNRIDQLAGGKKLLGIQCGVDIRVSSRTDVMNLLCVVWTVNNPYYQANCITNLNSYRIYSNMNDILAVKVNGCSHIVLE